ncbi:MAG: AAA family ATPase [Pseudomonadota bacterium]
MAEEEDSGKVLACAIARDLNSFDELINEMQTLYGDAWGGLDFADATSVLQTPEAADLQLVVLAVDTEDANDSAGITQIIQSCKTQGFQTVLVAKDLNPAALHSLMRLGADDFLPYPLPENALVETRDRFQAMQTSMPGQQAASQEVVVDATQARPRGPDRDGFIFPVYGLAGGVGSSTFAANLAWELQTLVEQKGKRVAIIDLDLQFGCISTYLDVPRTDATYELLSNAMDADDDTIAQIVSNFEQRLDILAAPSDAIPLEFVGRAEVEHLLNVFARNYDFVIVDLPKNLVSWTETVLKSSQLFFTLLELDMRSAQNALRFLRVLKSDDLPYEKVQFVLNRAPKVTDLTGRSRVKKLADSLDVQFRFFLPDGQKQVPYAGDHGSPLAEIAPKNPLRREIRKIATTLADLALSEEAKSEAN